MPAAANGPQAILQPVIYLPRYTGKVWEFAVLVRIKARRNSPQQVTKLRVIIAASPGALRGKTTWKNVLNDEAPSIYAASSSSLGIPLKKEIKTQVLKGIVNIRYTIIRAVQVSSNLKFLKRMYKGRAEAIGGNILIEIIQLANFLPPVLNRDIE